MAWRARKASWAAHPGPRSPDSRTERGVLGEPRGPTVHGSESCLLPPYTALASGDPQDREGP